MTVTDARQKIEGVLAPDFLTFVKAVLPLVTVLAVASAGAKAYVDLQIVTIEARLKHYSDENRHKMFSREDFAELMASRDEECDDLKQIQREIIVTLLPDLRTQIASLAAKLEAMNAKPSYGFPITGAESHAPNH